MEMFGSRGDRAVPKCGSGYSFPGYSQSLVVDGPGAGEGTFWLRGIDADFFALS